MGRHGRRRDHDEYSAESYYTGRGLPTHRRSHGTGRSGAERSSRKLRRVGWQCGTPLAVIFVMGIVLATAQYTKAVSRVRAAGIQQALNSGTSFRSVLAESMLTKPRAMPSQEQQRSAAQRESHVPSKERQAEEHEHRNPRNLKLNEAHPYSAHLEADNTRVSGIKSKPQKTATEAVGYNSNKSESAKRKKRKVSELDLLDAEEGGSEPDISVVGRRDTLSDPDLASLQATQREPLITGQEEIGGAEVKVVDDQDSAMMSDSSKERSESTDVKEKTEAPGQSSTENASEESEARGSEGDAASTETLSPSDGNEAAPETADGSESAATASDGKEAAREANDGEATGSADAPENSVADSGDGSEAAGESSGMSTSKEGEEDVPEDQGSSSGTDPESKQSVSTTAGESKGPDTEQAQDN